MVKEFVHSIGLHHSATLHNNGAVTDLVDHVQIVGNKEIAQVELLLQLHHQLQDLEPEWSHPEPRPPHPQSPTWDGQSGPKRYRYAAAVRRKAEAASGPGTPHPVLPCPTSQQFAVCARQRHICHRFSAAPQNPANSAHRIQRTIRVLKYHLRPFGVVDNLPLQSSNIPKTALAKVDFPLPLSPTTPSTSPSWMERLTSLRTCRRFRREDSVPPSRYQVFRCRVQNKLVSHKAVLSGLSKAVGCGWNGGNQAAGVLLLWMIKICSVLPRSTIHPLFITTIWEHSLRTTFRLWEMNRIEVPHSALIFLSSCKIWA